MQSFVDRLHLIHDKIDPVNSIRSVDSSDDQAFKLVMDSVQGLKDELQQTQSRLAEMEDLHAEEL
jgi:hypothetical protein